MTGMLIVGLLLSAEARAQRRGDVTPPPPDYAAQAFDAVVIRPLGLAGAAIGAALFVPAAILTLPGGRDSVEEAWEVFVLVPGKFVFGRPLGEF